MEENKVPEAGQSLNAVEELALWTGGEWKSLARARTVTQERLASLRNDLGGLDNLDTSIVVFGSLARDEATHASDIDWTLLIDGKADPKHLSMAQKIGRKIKRPPGREGTFGTLAFSHQILHCIGGEEDSNANTTRRVLLLLESKPLGNTQAWEDVQKNLLSRYLSEDRGLWLETNRRGVPLFLLNDIARFWRIMVVDFSYKQREREHEGSALRNIKLGLSRKLIYASGILACFSCDLDFPQKQLFDSGNAQRAIEHLRNAFCKTPLEIVAHALLQYDELRIPAKQLFDSYDRFIGLLEDERENHNGHCPRKHLESLKPADIATDPMFMEAQAIRREFGNALTDIFLRKESPIQQLMIERGVF